MTVGSTHEQCLEREIDRLRAQIRELEADRKQYNRWAEEIKAEVVVMRRLIKAGDELYSSFLGAIDNSQRDAMLEYAEASNIYYGKPRT